MKRFNLMLFRKKRGLLQSEMAEKLGLSKSHYVGIENGFADPSWKTLEKFARTFPDQKDIWGLFNNIED